MRAAVCPVHGDPEVVETRDIPSPELVAGSARVRVRAAGVNFPDVLLIADRYQVSVPVPFVPGSEFAGEVIEIAGDVNGFVVGDRVSGGQLVGAFAEEAVVPAGALLNVPAAVDLRHAAVFGVAHRTSYHALRSFGHLHPGEELVVLGAAGGVGLAAVQLGVAMGATVTAVASTDEKLAVAQQHGASRLVNYTTTDLRAALKEALPSGSDVVLDPVGGDLSEPALRSLRWGGRFVTVGFAAGAIPRIPLNLVLLKGVHVTGFQFLDFAVRSPEFARNEAELSEMLADGRVSPHIGASFPLAEAGAALRYVAEGRAIGKVVLDVGV